MPGHAYTVLDGDRRIRIETTTQGPEGFDYKPEALANSKEHERALYATAFASYGVVPDPMKFVAQQFHNTTLASIDTLVLNKYEQRFRQILKTDLGWDDFRQTEAIERWRRHGRRGIAGVRQAH